MMIIALTWPIFNLCPLDFAWQQIQVIPKYDDDYNDGDNDDDDDDNNYDEENHKSRLGPADFAWEQTFSLKLTYTKYTINYQNYHKLTKITGNIPKINRNLPNNYFASYNQSQFNYQLY